MALYYTELQRSTAGHPLALLLERERKEVQMTNDPRYLLHYQRFATYEALAHPLPKSAPYTMTTTGQDQFTIADRFGVSTLWAGCDPQSALDAHMRWSWVVTRRN